MATIAELTALASTAEEPVFITKGTTKFGGVDPLGLRQINFDLMDEVFPGLNNVARHVRPFVVVAWAWRRAFQRAETLGTTLIKQGELQDFVDRIEVVYLLSQVLREKNADLPGRQYVVPWLKETQFEFGGDKWKQRRNERRFSTALSAPANYGAALRALGWISRHPTYAALMIPNPAVAPALASLEAEVAAMLDHPVFNAFGSVTVTRDELRRWAGLWALDEVTGAEAEVMAELLVGAAAPVGRRFGAQLMIGAAEELNSAATAPVRAAMTGAPSPFNPPDHLLEIRNAWRRVQVRQLFRLSLEAFFHWTMHELTGPARSIDALVKNFVDQVPSAPGISDAGGWIRSLASPSDGPTERMTRIEQAMDDRAAGDLPHSIAAGLAFCLAEGPSHQSKTEPIERLPLARAAREAAVRSEASVEEFVRHVLEGWVLAQHAYWAVGRGLADARARGKTLLRLRIILDEGGWTLTPGATIRNPPIPTPDRLETAITLARECGLFDR